MEEMSKEEIKELQSKLRDEAKQLGIEIKGNPGVEKLQKMINDFYDNESADADIAVAKVEEEEDVDTSKVVKKKVIKEDPRVAAIMRIKEQERENIKTQVVKITMVDKREASTATHAYFSTGNVAMNVPLDVWVEMPYILIQQAENSKALSHVESGDTTIPRLQKRYVVEYRR